MRASFLLLALLAASPVFGQDLEPPFGLDSDLWGPIPEEAWTEEGWQLEGDPAAVVLREMVFAVDDIVSMRVVHRRIKIRKESGGHYAELAFPYEQSASGSQRIHQIEARTVYPGGRTVPVDPSLIRSAMAYRGPDQADEVHVQYVSMPGITAGCIIESLVTIVSDYHDPLWEFQKEIPVLEGIYVWSFGDVIVAAAEFFADSPSPHHLWIQKPREADMEVIQSMFGKAVVFVVANVPAREFVPLALPGSDARLLTYYAPDGTADDFWRELGDSATETIVAWSRESRTVRDLVEKAKARDDQPVTDILSWLHEQVEVDPFLALTDQELAGLLSEEGLEEVVRTTPVSPSSFNLLAFGVLSSLEQDASLALARDRRMGVFFRDLKTWQFDRVLLRLDEADTGFCSPGDTPTDPLLLPWFYESGFALHLAGEDSQLTSTPALSALQSSQVLELDLRLTLDGTLEGQVALRATGHTAAEIQSELSLWGDASADGARALLSERFPLARITDAQSSFSTSGAYLNASVHGHLDLPEGETTFRPYYELGILKDTPPLPDRDQTIAFEHPFTDSLVIRMEVPESFVVEGLNRPVVVDNAAGSFRGEFRTDGNRIFGVGALRLEQALLAAEATDAVNDLFDGRIRYTRAPVLLLPR